MARTRSGGKRHVSGEDATGAGSGEEARVRITANSGPYRIEVIGFGNGHMRTHEFVAWGSDPRYERCRTCGEARRVGGEGHSA